MAAARPELFPAMPEDRAAFPRVTVDPRKVLEETVKDRLLDGKPIKLRVNRFYKQVEDFARDEDGAVIRSSLTGPARLEAQEQLARERLVALAEWKILKEEVGRCYQREGVNHLENCKHLVKAYAAVISTPFYGMLKPPGKKFDDMSV